MTENNEPKWWQDASGVWRLTEANAEGSSTTNESTGGGQNYGNSAWSPEDLERYRNENFSYYNRDYLKQEYGTDSVSFTKDHPKDSFVSQIYKTSGNQFQTDYLPTYDRYQSQYNSYNYQNVPKKRKGKVIALAVVIPIMIISLIISLIFFVVVPGINRFVQKVSNYEYLGNTGVPNNGTYPPNSTPNSSQIPIAITNFNSVLNPQIEQSVINNVWTPFTGAVISRNTAVLSSYAIPSAVDIVVGALSCGCQPWSLTYSQIAFTAPVQNTYPIYFLAQMLGKSYEGYNETRIAIFSQNTPTSAWMIDAVSIYSGPQSQPVIGTYSNATTNIIQSVPATANTLLTPTPQQIVSWLQTIDTSSTVPVKVPPLPADFASNSQVTDVIQQNDKTNQFYLTHSEKTMSQTHTLNFVSPVFYVGNQSYLICANNEYNISLGTTNGSPLVQPTDLSQFGYQLPAGSYTTVKYFSNHSSCFMSDLNQVWWWSDYGGTYAMVGVP